MACHQHEEIVEKKELEKRQRETHQKEHNGPRKRNCFSSLQVASDVLNSSLRNRMFFDVKDTQRSFPLIVL